MRRLHWTNTSSGTCYTGRRAGCLLVAPWWDNGCGTGPPDAGCCYAGGGTPTIQVGQARLAADECSPVGAREAQADANADLSRKFFALFEWVATGTTRVPFRAGARARACSSAPRRRRGRRRPRRGAAGQLPPAARECRHPEGRQRSRGRLGGRGGLRGHHRRRRGRLRGLVEAVDGQRLLRRPPAACARARQRRTSGARARRSSGSACDDGVLGVFPTIGQPSPTISCHPPNACCAVADAFPVSRNSKIVVGHRAPTHLQVAPQWALSWRSSGGATQLRKCSACKRRRTHRARTATTLP